MKENQEQTPPSSINGDELYPLDGDDELIYLGDVDEVLEMGDQQFGDQESSCGSDYEPPPDMATTVFTEHIGSVFCCHLHPNGKMAVSGGEDDKAYVWNIENGEVLMECSGHKDSVIIADFSHDGQYLATADMSGFIQVWKCNLEGNDPWSRIWDYEAGELAWGMWHIGTRVLMCGGQEGEIYVFKVPSGETKVLQGNNLKAECAKLFPDGRRLASGYDDGSIKIWDLKSEQVLHHVQSTGHSNGITCLDVHPDNNLIISVSSDGKVVLTTASTGKVKSQIVTDEELEAVAFCKDQEFPYFAAGTLEGNLSIWDTARQVQRYYCMKKDTNNASGTTKLLWEKNFLFAACLDGSVRIFDCKSGECINTFTGHRSEVLDIIYRQKESLILTASQDSTVRVFKYELPTT